MFGAIFFGLDRDKMDDKGARCVCGINVQQALIKTP